MCLLDLFGLSLIDKADKASKLPKGTREQQKAEADFWEDFVLYDMMKKDNEKKNEIKKKDKNGWW